MIDDPEARRDTPLAKKLKERIRREGPITVADYMRACLHDPEYGYYVKQPAIGATGDFITAPEISQVFGELTGLWCAVVWQQLGSPAKVNLVELGPGRGTLMRDALRASRIVSGFREAISVHLVESSEPLRATQQASLMECDAAITWHSMLGTLPRGASIIVANELIDALPIEQVVKSNGQWHWRHVGLDENDALAFKIGPKSSLAPPASLSQTAEDGSIFEHADAVYDLIEAIKSLCGDEPLAALAIDYGHMQTMLGETLQGVKRHEYVSPIETPGETDITSLVDFEQVGQACAHSGFAVDGPVTQSEFLGSLGIMERASRLMAANPAQAGEIEAGVARLMAPNGMGTRFKAIGIRSTSLPKLPGFP